MLKKYEQYSWIVWDHRSIAPSAFAQPTCANVSGLKWYEITLGKGRFLCLFQSQIPINLMLKKRAWAHIGVTEP